MLKITLIILGLFSLSFGVIGIFVPGLPTTPFILLSAGLFARSSEKIYFWLINHKILGKYIKNFRSNKKTPLKTQIGSLIIMWLMIGISTLFLIDNPVTKIIVLIVGIIGTLVMTWIWFIKKVK